jgi:TetR/AcrR family transcriptional regulator, transcriptional repressor for nem operon
MKDRRSQIIDAATALICRGGYAQTSVEDVIREAGLCGKSHFYHHFKSKEELGYAVLQRQFQRFAELELSVLKDPLVPPLTRLERFIDVVIGAQGERDECGAGCPFGNLSVELAERHEGMRRELSRVFERWARQLDALLYEARDELEDGTDTERLAHTIVATLEGAMLMSRVQRKAEITRGIGEQLKQFVTSCIRRREVVAATSSAERSSAAAPAPAGAAGGRAV